MRKWLCTLLLSAVVGGSTLSAQPTPGVNPQAKQDQAVVQIILYGLMVFEFNHPTSPTLIRAFLPKAGNHEPRVQHGEYDDNNKSFEWKKLFVKGDFEKGTEIRVEFDPPPAPSLSVPSYAMTISDYPGSPTEARDARWMLLEKEVAGGNGHRIHPSKTYAMVLLDHGTFETCGLVYNNVSDWKVCKAEAGGAKRAMSEYMVLRAVVPKETVVKVRVGIESRAVSPTGDSYDGFAKAYDISVTNLDWSQNQRKPTTPHGNDLRKLFPKATSKWNDFFYNPLYCTSTHQPPCLDRYKNWGGGSGYNRPLCPFVGGG